MAGQVDSPPVTTPSSSIVSHNPASQQLIVKFKPDTIGCDEQGIARFSGEVKVKIAHVRAMSGAACVIKQFADKDGRFELGQVLLKQHPDVEWFELDAIMKHFK